MRLVKIRHGEHVETDVSIEYLPDYDCYRVAGRVLPEKYRRKEDR